MKRFIHLIIFILCHVHAYSQNIILPTNFWGLEIGKTNFDETLHILKNNNYQYEIRMGDESQCTAIGITNKLYIEGIEWPVSYIGFEDGILSDIMFTEETSGKNEEQFKKFKKVCKLVMKKYIGCRIKYKKYDCLIIEDDQTYLCVFNKFINGSNILCIQFVNTNLSIPKNPKR